MITAIVRFPLARGTTLEQAREAYEGSAPKYRGLAGLVRKYYLFDAAAGIGGGCYLWESREAAESFYDDAWKRFIADRYGAEPEITIFDTPVIVDNTMEVSAAAD